MQRYFMSDTPLAGLERMMMDPSRRADSDDGQKRRQKTEKPPLTEQRSGKECQ